MSRNGSGTYNLPAGNPVVTGNTISSSWANTTLSDIASALTGSIAADGQTTPTANLVMGTYAHTGVGNATARTMYASAGQVQDSVLTYLTSVAGTNAITASAPIVMTAYATGQTFRFIAAGASTGAVTININSIGLKSVVRTDGSALVSGDIASGAAVQIMYDGTNFQLLSDANGKSETFTAITTGSLTDTGLTSGRVTYASTGGLLADSANLTFNGTTLTTANDASISGLTVGKGLGSGSNNTAVGYVALGSNTSGLANTAVGRAALSAVTTGSSNTAVGSNALQSSTGSYNTAVGDLSLVSNTTASNNTAVGYQSLYTNVTGIYCVAVGSGALKVSTANYNTALGGNASFANTTGANNVAVGTSSQGANTSGSNNVSVGFESLNANTTASSNVAVGYRAAYSNTTGASNTVIGNEAGFLNTTGTKLTAVGFQAGFANAGGDTNSAFGYQALYANTAYYNTGIGAYTLTSNTGGAQNTALGHEAGIANTTGVNQTFIGFRAGLSQTTGGTYGGNTFVGASAGYSSTTGTVNTFIGAGSGTQVTTGSYNTILGGYNGNQGGLNIATASNYIVLSDGAGNPRGIFDGAGNFLVAKTIGDDTSQIGVMMNGGVNAGAMTATYNTAVTKNTYHLYNINATNNGYRFYVGVNGGINNFSANNVNLSDERVKKDIVNAGNYLDKICAIPVRTFLYKDQSDDDLNLGVIAQEVEAIAPELVSNAGFGDTPEDGVPLKTIYQTDLQYALMKCIQELKAEIDLLKGTK